MAQINGIPAYDSLLSNYEYPFEVDYHPFSSQNQDLFMAFMDINPEGKQGNVLLLHGKNFNGAYWKTTIEFLKNQDYRIIVPDQIGFGKSSKPVYYQFSFQQLATNTQQLLDTLEVEKTVVLGHSMGGMLATRFALMYPKLTEKLILVNPIGLEDWKVKVPYRPIGWWYKNELKKDFQAIKNYQRENYYDGTWKPEYDAWVNILAGWTQHPAYNQVAWNAALTYDMIFTQPVVYEFKNLQMPTHLIIGTRDRTALGKPLVSEEVRKTMGLYDQLGETIKAKIPNAKLTELNDLGHLPHIEDFERFKKALTEALKK